MRTIALMIVVTLIASAFPAGMAFAQGDEDVPTSAQIDPQGTPPQVLYKWELPDWDRNNANGVQYRNDDDPNNNVGVQIAPNLEDEPTVLHIGYWWVATDPNGIADIKDAFIRVFHPDGSLKYQLHGTQQPCTALGAANQPTTPLGAAVTTGQLTTAQANLILEECGKNVMVPYFVAGELSKHQPCGAYTVRASATDQAGNTHTLSNTMTVLCVVGLRIDFAGVDYGQILPNTPKWVRGDQVWGGLPSVKNVGNTNMYLWLEFSNMIGAEFQKLITVFDAKLNTQEIYPIPANSAVCFANEPLGSNEIGQLDLSIHPGFIPADIYSGILSLWGRQSC